MQIFGKRKINQRSKIIKRMRPPVIGLIAQHTKVLSDICPTQPSKLPKKLHLRLISTKMVQKTRWLWWQRRKHKSHSKCSLRKIQSCTILKSHFISLSQIWKTKDMSKVVCGSGWWLTAFTFWTGTSSASMVFVSGYSTLASSTSLDKTTFTENSNIGKVLMMNLRPNNSICLQIGHSVHKLLTSPSLNWNHS